MFIDIDLAWIYQLFHLMRAGLTCFGATLLAGCTQLSPTQGTCQLTQPLPLDVYFNTVGLPFVVAGVNGVPAAMLLDTGSTSSILTPDIAKQAGLRLDSDDDPLRMSGAGGVQTAALTYVSQFQVGSAVAKNMQMVVTEMADWKDSSGQPVILDGILAENVMKYYDVDFDLQHGKATFYAAGDCASVTPPWTGAADAIPIQVDYYGDVYLPVTIDGHTITAMLDTGSTINNMSDTLFDATGLRATSKILRSNLEGRGIGGEFGEDIYMVGNMTIGGETFDHQLLMVVTQLPISVTAPNATEAQQEKFQRIEQLMRRYNAEAEDDGNPFYQFSRDKDMILGESFIRHHRIFVSYATHMLYIQKD